ncbi:MAG TPA: MlaD family protein [Paludibacteraceae bacterium]|nr:MlaD family protein [Paludibacteraceae bacterium]
MKKKFFNKEVKIGLMVIIAIFLLYFGINFLKGIDIFSPTRSYYSVYEKLDGLVTSSPVFIKGYKVGQVDKIQYDFSQQKSFIVKISIEKNIRLPEDTKIELFDNGLMGGKALQLILNQSGSQHYLQPGDTIPSQISVGLMGQITNSLLPKIESISSQADSLLTSLRKLSESEKINNSLTSLEETSANFAYSSKQLKNIMNNEIPVMIDNVNSLTTDFKAVSNNIKGIDFASTVGNIDQTINNLNLMSDKINNGEGTLGLLLTDKELYFNLANTTVSANNLLIDLKNNPKRYVHFSVFGNKTK